MRETWEKTKRCRGREREKEISPDDSRRDLCAVEDTKSADGMRGEHSDDGKRHREPLIQRVPENCY